MDRFLEPWGMHEGTLVFSFSMVPDKEKDKCEKGLSQESDSIWIRVIMGLDIAQKESSHHLKIITEGSPLLATIGAVMHHRRRALPSCLVPCHPVHGVDALYMPRPKCKTLGLLVVKSSCLVFDLLSGSPILAKVSC
ncbi:hypothetical protein F2Q68_00012624 [Brassica cretica]|uniref:Uncharacterized protein n=1 Tax=Brassica cretica TaxID=69181 RepID=A0A8S9KY69_BRACR|nr:hypothetical protein F2Q68_00012624 [Brassica cretica]